MPLSLGLAMYRALSWRTAQPVQDPPPPRPRGPLIWMHATSPERHLALRDLGARLRAQRPEVNLLITVNASVPVAAPWRDPVPVPVMSDHPLAVRAFLDHWKPDLCLWTGGDLMPNLISLAADRGTVMVLADLEARDLPRRRAGWLTDLTRPCLERFGAILTASDAAATQLRRLGVSGARIEAHSRLLMGVSPPPCPDTALTAAAQALSGRPLWLAAYLQPEEFAPVLAAHRDALRFQHRLLLVAVPAEPGETGALTEAAGAAGLRFADWHGGDPIGEEVQLLICDDSSDLGLWYRMAPITFMAGSLAGGATGHAPFAAAALGSAVLYGPNIADHAEAYARLAQARAARAVQDAETLAQAVVQLSAPDHAAAMALAGWDTITESAAVTDHLIELIQDLLDRKEARDARA
ncbi:3-deoxy-D-manno-octulosonic acid transferase [Antarcticimicrobium luteum]|uniref:3-deoxy-D-manno-octulosonic acid transferase n=1 Tax=Antarcticimicrobium luteum TaxID=2547397 RepID=A0A4V3ARD4_9RHOB|nr:glycosyltransferase N-terminal domain-containing protein [Antarcticimicrobium luteum]TDK46207.1 3-deoxy-D-manno-octulosonic acid transferase [Antarcticimicrobium luteum]